MKYLKGFIGWVCTVVMIGLVGAVIGVSIGHPERDENGNITAFKYD